jgi:bacterial/archaeal transporter family-2 protein
VSRLLYALLPVAAGILIAAQAPINARLRLSLASPLGSGLVSFAVGTVLLLGAVAVVGDGGAILSGLGSAPWWAYLGGAFGAVFVVVTLVAAPRLGVTATFVAVILGQVAAATLIDRFGWFGQPAIALTGERVLAIGLLMVSLVLLVRHS